jgi:hypothetical protein
MINNFYSDLEKGKTAEKIVLDTFSALTTNYLFDDVSNYKGFYYRGDIRAISADGREIFIEVKNDSRIADTGNVLCEEEVYYKEAGYCGIGNMDCDSDIFAVVSQKEKKIYVIDFKVLKENYRKGEYKEINHPQQITYCYLCGLYQIKAWGGLLAIVDYEAEEFDKVKIF